MYFPQWDSRFWGIGVELVLREFVLSVWKSWGYQWFLAPYGNEILFLHPHIKDQLTFNILCAHFEFVFEFIQHARELLVTIGTRVEAWIHLVDSVTHHVQSRPAILSYGHFECLTQDRHWVSFLFFWLCFSICLFRSTGLCPSLLYSFFLFDQIFRVNKQIAGVDESLRRLLLTDAHHKNPSLADTRGKTRVITIGGNQAESIH